VTIVAGLAEDNPTDVNFDCITNIEDLAELGLTWLTDTSLTSPVVK
jgi:hypothetical protein